MTMFWAGFLFGVFLGVKHTTDNVVMRLKRQDGMAEFRRARR